MSQHIPATMRALVVQADKTAKVEERAVPTIDGDEILIRAIAVAQNPIDLRAADFFRKPGAILGCDVAGRVVAVGKDVHTVSPGDIVATFVHSGVYQDRGAFAEYVKASAELTWKVPDNITPEQAATLGATAWTVGQAFFHSGRLGLVEPPAKVEGEQWFYIHGGSSSTGLYAIQVAKLAGYKVITVASPRNHALCKSLGADVVLDYNAPDTLSKIREITKNSIQYGIDTISTEKSESFAVQTFGPVGGKLLIIREDARLEDLRPDVKLTFTLIFTALGKEFQVNVSGKTVVFPASPSDRAAIVEWIKKQTDLVKQGLLKPNPVRLMEGGLEGIPAGLKYMEDGKTSAEKLVYRV